MTEILTLQASIVPSALLMLKFFSLKGSVVASDAFFPFPDAIEFIAETGATSIIHPGGSVRDKEIILTADKLGLGMIFTGFRHFRH